ncbi:MAG TPA: endo-1,4-beta-xylanase [Phycisphaerae bacterium]|nr:endo-1,4-beta-xylanase [Phycisphaerae bacterium]
MLRFVVNRDANAVRDMDLAGAYVVGSDGVPLRAELEFRESEICCAKRADGPAALALLWPIPGCGAMLLETSRLTDREHPYNLPLELARGRLMRISLKREDWGLFDFEGVEPLNNEYEQGRDLLVEALKADNVAEQSQLGDKALQMAVMTGEKLSKFHADLFLARRKQIHAFTRRTLGCWVDIANGSDAYRQAIKESADLVYLPVPWRLLEPKRGEVNWRPFDSWVEWLAKSRIPMRLGPLVSFSQSHLPVWLIGETAYEAVRNLCFEHIRRMVDRYGNYVFQWDVVSGIHAENTFDFNFEQLMEITRVSVALVKQLAPKAQTLVDVIAPWGEYYARNQRTIPPMLYADMIVQSGVGFDGLGVQFLFGQAADGMYIRDMFQISDKLDRLGSLGKTLHVTAVQVPSEPPAAGSTGGGCWRKPWDKAVQAAWVKEFYTIALSKPFVETVSWVDLVDRPGNAAGLAAGGLLHADMIPKPAFKILKDLRAEIRKAIRKPPAAAKAADADT